MLKCHECGKERVLIHDRCAECAPAVFEIHAMWAKFIEHVSAAYRRENDGADPLQNWTAFEAFLFDRYQDELRQVIDEEKKGEKNAKDT